MTNALSTGLATAARYAIAFGFLFAGSVTTWAGSAHPETVKIDNFTFTPAVLTVAPGTTVTWTNGDDIPHTVVASDKSYKSRPLDTNDTFSHVFTTAGEYGYFCSLHPHMTGKIVVKAP